MSKKGIKGANYGGDDQLLKIRITLTSVDVKRLEKGVVCMRPTESHRFFLKI